MLLPGLSIQVLLFNIEQLIFIIAVPEFQRKMAEQEEQLKQQSGKNIKRACVRALLKVIRRTNTCVNIDFLYNK